MKTKQVHLKKTSNIGNEIQNLKGFQPQLLMVFANVKDIVEGQLAQVLAKEFPQTKIVGCSTAGEITNKGSFGGTTVIQACKFDSSVRVQATTEEINGMKDSLECGRRLGRKLQKDGLKFVFLLGCGLNINGSLIVSGLQEVLGKNVIITGGLAGDNEKFLSTYTFVGHEVSDHSVLALGFYGGSIEIAFGSVGGWEPFGPVRRVTKSEDNVLYEIDGEPALDIYKRYLGDRTKDLPASGLLYPFAILKDNQDTSGLIRTILNVDEKNKSLILAGDIPEMGLVQLMHSSNKGLISGARQAAEYSVQGLPAGAEGGLGILISCVGRKMVMGDDIDDELDAVQEVLKQTPVVGFYSYGEICPQHGFQECKLHNQTMTITYLYEKNAA